jgi:hypothetical protein
MLGGSQMGKTLSQGQTFEENNIEHRIHDIFDD